MGHTDDFELVVSFTPEGSIVRVRGEIDLRTAPFLRAGLAALVIPPVDLVLDLADVAFMDAAGLGVIAEVSARLATADRVLTVRAATTRSLRLFCITGIDNVVRLEAGSADRDVLAREQRLGDDSFTVAPRPADLTSDLLSVGTKANRAILDAALRRVTVLADVAVDGADGVSVTLERNGTFATVASSNDTVLRMDHHQYEAGEGPCLSAAAEGHWFHSESLTDETRWPTFIPHAIDEGIASILSTPLLTAERPIGALNIYSNTERVFGARQQELAAMFAGQISDLLIEAGEGANDVEMAERISKALHAREIIARAQGILMSRDHLSAERATAFLQRAGRDDGTTVLFQARAVIETAGQRPHPADRRLHDG